MRLTLGAEMAQEDALKQSQPLQIRHSFGDGIIPGEVRKIGGNQMRACAASDVDDAGTNVTDHLLFKRAAAQESKQFKAVAAAGIDHIKRQIAE